MKSCSTSWSNFRTTDDTTEWRHLHMHSGQVTSKLKWLKWLKVTFFDKRTVYITGYITYQADNVKLQFCFHNAGFMFVRACICGIFLTMMGSVCKSQRSKIGGTMSSLLDTQTQCESRICKMWCNKTYGVHLLCASVTFFCWYPFARKRISRQTLYQEQLCIHAGVKLRPCTHLVVEKIWEQVQIIKTPKYKIMIFGNVWQTLMNVSVK